MNVTEKSGFLLEYVWVRKEREEEKDCQSWTDRLIYRDGRPGGCGFSASISGPGGGWRRDGGDKTSGPCTSLSGVGVGDEEHQDHGHGCLVVVRVWLPMQRY